MDALIIGFVILFIQGWVVWYLAYFKKKGEYEAIKEEIDHITKATETIKSELNFLTQKEINLDVLKRNSILEYNDALELAIHDLLHKTRIDKPKTLDDYHVTAYSRYIIAASRLKLCVSNENVIDLIVETNNCLEGMIVAQVNSAEFARVRKGEDDEDLLNASKEIVEEQSNDLVHNYNQMIKCQEQLRELFRTLL